MKEATGELNMTVVTVVAIAAVAAFFYAFIWPNIKNSITASTYCAMATCDQASCNTDKSKTVCTSCRVDADDTTGQKAWSGKCSFENGTSQAK